jgi:hypothetical protein
VLLASIVWLLAVMMLCHALSDGVIFLLSALLGFNFSDFHRPYFLHISRRPCSNYW